MIKRLFKLIIIFLLIVGVSYSQEVISSYDDVNISILNDEIRKARKGESVLQKIYPVGGIYISTLSKNPSELLGFGTWEAFAAGRVLVGIDSTQTEFDVGGETGGAKTHTLQITEIPAHSHDFPHVAIFAAAGVGNPWAPSNTGGPAEIAMSNTGGGKAHNNLQPYIVVYIWKRTA